MENANTHKKTVAPQLSMSILTTQQTETTGSPFMNTSRGLLMLIGISSGTGLVLINILLIACCLHKRHKKNLKGGKNDLQRNFEASSVLNSSISWRSLVN